MTIGQEALNYKKHYPFGESLNPGLACASSGRASGNMSLFYGDTKEALANRRNFLGELNIDYRLLVCAKQVHGGVVKYAQDSDSGRGALSYADSFDGIDAFITDKKNLPLAIFTADCLSVFLYDPQHQAIGLVHAGWRSTKECITARALGMMREKFNTRAEDLCAGFGPAIRSCCYEVGGDFVDLFAREYITDRDGRYYLDLAGINKKQLLSSGVKDKNIFDPGACTACRNQEFFSLRREGPGCGRALSVIMLR